MNRFFIFLLLFSFNAVAQEIKTLPALTEQVKYKNRWEDTPFHNRESMFYAGAHIGLKNGFGTDLNYCFFIREFLCAGVNTFIGSLKSSHLVRTPLVTDNSDPFPESPPNTDEYTDLIENPETWSAIVPQLGLTVNGPLLSLIDPRWSESTWFGIGKAFLGGFSGWAISIEPSLNRTFSYQGNWGMSIKARYTYGWLNPKNDTFGSIPFDWYNISAGIYYLW